MPLKSNVYRELCTKVFDPLYEENTWRILVLDEYSTKIISNILKMHDIFDKGITLVDDLNKKRQPVPIEAIYLISPQTNKIQLLIDDFENSPTYSNAHVFFTDECITENLNLLGKSAAANYILTLKEININFLISENQLFHFDFQFDDNNFNSFNELDHEKSWELARAISGLCEILNENPSIYYQNSDRAQRFAIKVQQEMVKTAIENPKLGQAIHKDRSILLIVDRSLDPLTPLLHDLHLQCMAHDLLDIVNNTYSYKNQETEKISTVDLTETDQLWVQIRHMHIADVSGILPLKLKQLANAQKCIDNTVNSSDSEKKTLGPSDENGKSTNKDYVAKQLRIMMKKMPHLRQEAVSVSNMFYLSEACLSAFQAGVNQLCECEQNLVIGTDASGEPVKLPDKLVINVINNTMATMSEKLRLLLTLVMSQSGMQEEVLMDLVQKMRIDERCHNIFTGLRQLGDFILSKPNNVSKVSAKMFPFLLKNRKSVLDGYSYTLSRWIPFIKDILEDIIRGQINRNLVSKLDSPKLRNYSLKVERINFTLPQRHSWTRSSDVDDHVGPRLIVFFVGGVSLAETRVAYDITKLCQTMKSGHVADHIKKNSQYSLENGGGRGWSWEVIIGGTSILTPEKYLEFLSKTK